MTLEQKLLELIDDESQYFDYVRCKELCEHCVWYKPKDICKRPKGFCPYVELCNRVARFHESQGASKALTLAKEAREEMVEKIHHGNPSEVDGFKPEDSHPKYYDLTMEMQEDAVDKTLGFKPASKDRK